MTPLITTLKNTSRAALVAMALGATALTAAPVQAQSGPSFSFSFSIDGGRFSFDSGMHRRGDFFDHRRDRRFCLTNRQVRRALIQHGFRNIRFVADLGRNRVEVRAQRGRWVYKMRVNRCTGLVDRVQRLRRIGGGSFGLHFQFGN